MKDVTPAELSVLEALWEAGALTIRELTDALYPRGGTSHYATVQKLLDRLGDKGCVRRSKEGRAFRFEAAVAKEDLIDHKLQAVADQLCDGSLTPLLTHLVKERRLKAGEIQDLRTLLDELDRKRRRKR